MTFNFFRNLFTKNRISSVPPNVQPWKSEVQLKVANEGHGNVAEPDYPVVHSD
jgi:hypothetical protein